MTVIINWNFLIIRYIVLDINSKLVEGVIFQLPWDTLQEALSKRKFFTFN